MVEQQQDEAFDDAEELSESIQQDIGEATGGTAAGGGGKGGSAGGANAQVEEANKLLECISDAGGDVSAIQACNASFGP